MRQTKQKMVLTHTIYSFKSFFDADDVHHKLSSTHPQIGIATIYRLLRDLSERGEIHAFYCERRTIYSNNRNNHCHFVCERCAEKKHIQLNKLDFLRSEIKGEICHFQIDVSGICEKCCK